MISTGHVTFNEDLSTKTEKADPSKYAKLLQRTQQQANPTEVDSDDDDDVPDLVDESSDDSSDDDNDVRQHKPVAFKRQAKPALPQQLQHPFQPEPPLKFPLLLRLNLQPLQLLPQLLLLQLPLQLRQQDPRISLPKPGEQHQQSAGTWFSPSRLGLACPENFTMQQWRYIQIHASKFMRQ